MRFLAARKLTAGLAGLALLAALAVLRRPAADATLAAAEWVEGLGWIAPVVFTALFAAGIPLFVPAAPFLLFGGVLFGPVLGTLVGFLGNVAGGALSFALGRYLLREPVEARLGAYAGFAAMREALRREGLRGAALIRVSPALPAWLINYALGVSPLRWRHYLLSAIAVLPTTVLYALSGAGVGDLAALEGGRAAAHGPVYYLLLATGILATIAATVLLGRRARTILETIDDD